MNDKPSVTVTIRTKDDTITSTVTLNEWDAIDTAIRALDDIAQKIREINYSVVPADRSDIEWRRTR